LIYEPLEVAVPQSNSDEPLPPLAMLAATSPGSRRGEEESRRAAKVTKSSGEGRRGGNGTASFCHRERSEGSTRSDESSLPAPPGGNHLSEVSRERSRKIPQMAGAGHQMPAVSHPERALRESQRPYWKTSRGPPRVEPGRLLFNGCPECGRVNPTHR